MVKALSTETRTSFLASSLPEFAKLLTPLSKQLKKQPKSVTFVSHLGIFLTRSFVIALYTPFFLILSHVYFQRISHISIYSLLKSMRISFFL